MTTIEEIADTDEGELYGEKFRIRAENNWWVRGEVEGVEKEMITRNDYYIKGIHILPLDRSGGWIIPDGAEDDLGLVVVDIDQDSGEYQATLTLHWYEEGYAEKDGGNVQMIVGNEDVTVADISKID